MDTLALPCCGYCNCIVLLSSNFPQTLPIRDKRGKHTLLVLPKTVEKQLFSGNLGLVSINNILELDKSDVLQTDQSLVGNESRLIDAGLVSSCLNPHDSGIPSLL